MISRGIKREVYPRSRGTTEKVSENNRRTRTVIAGEKKKKVRH